MFRTFLCNFLCPLLKTWASRPLNGYSTLFDFSLYICNKQLEASETPKNYANYPLTTWKINYLPLQSYNIEFLYFLR